MEKYCDRIGLKNHIRRIGRIDIEALIAIYDSPIYSKHPSIEVLLRNAWTRFTHDHEGWEQEGLSLLGSFLKRVAFSKKGNWPTGDKK